MLRRTSTLALAVMTAFGLTACLEAQPAPDLPTVPSTAFEIVRLAEGLDKPMSVAALPDGGYLTVQKDGAVLHVVAGEAEKVSDGPDDRYYIPDPQSQAGMFDVVLSPDFDESGEVYFGYAYGTAEANGTGLARSVWDGERLSAPVTLYRADPKDTNAHYGGRIAFLPDGSLVLSSGDGFVYREAAQDPGTTIGKLIHLSRDGDPIGDGIYSSGHRNAQGLAYDAATQTLWEHEHGPRGGDELNAITRGGNYGWPVVTTGVDYNGARISPFETAPDFTGFAKDWVPSIAPSGLVIYRGAAFPEWQGDALIGALAAKSLRRVDLDNGVFVSEEIVVPDLDARIRDVAVDRDGGVLLVANGAANGQILKLLPK